MEMNLPKRREIRARIPKSESPAEAETKHALLKQGFRVEQQFPIGPFFADFAVPKKRLVVEYDGKVHLDRPVEDYRRHQYIRSLGWNIVRIMNKGVFYEIYHNEENIGLAPNMDTAIELAAKEAARRYHPFGDYDDAEDYWEEGGKGSGFVDLRKSLPKVDKFRKS